MPTKIKPTYIRSTFLLIVLFSLLLASCQKDKNGSPQTTSAGVNCDTVSCPVPTEFYGAGLMNGGCWFAEGTFFDRILSNGYYIILAFNVNGIEQRLSFDISRNVDLQDTVWLARGNVDDAQPNTGKAWYSYHEGDAVAGDFQFAKNAPPTYEDYLLIDYFNEDTTLLEGRFKLRFTDRSVSAFVEDIAPDSMRFECGRFRVEQY